MRNAFLSIEHDIHFLTVIGIEDLMKKDTVASIQDIKDRGSKVWMVSGDSDANVVSAAQITHIFRPGQPLVELKKINSPFQCYKILSKIIENKIYHRKNKNSRAIEFQFRRRKRRFTSMLDKAVESYKESYTLRENAEVALSKQPFFKQLSNRLKKKTLDLKETFSEVDFCILLDRTSFKTCLLYTSDAADE